ncbi:hypothetical protein CTAYLR_005602 [Chrysophaeum taylorii]|uniref:Uncharacterized protein n=1 Tax=Chrysophaeum taylorii TaxID=2483200 RepID=A0AAD7XIX4_9STRA|nr:hypothetical protein CTAYLR_005602 [Chrysophaeum taylorii]
MFATTQVISANEHDDEVVWYEMVDGKAFEPHVVDDAAMVCVIIRCGRTLLRRQHPVSIHSFIHSQGVQAVYAADINADGRMDVLSASSSDHAFAWYEQGVDGEFTKHVIGLATGARSIVALDMDADGDADVVAAATAENTIFWFEQQEGVTWKRHVVSTSVHHVRQVWAGDLDGDGDMDILSASKSDNRITLFASDDGAQSFTQLVLDDEALDARSVFGYDVDGDGDVDVLAASAHDDTIALYDNPSWEKTVVTNDVRSPTFVHALDIDNDGFAEIFAAWDDSVTMHVREGDGYSADLVSNAVPGAHAVLASDFYGKGEFSVFVAAKARCRHRVVARVRSTHAGAHNFEANDVPETDDRRPEQAPHICAVRRANLRADAGAVPSAAVARPYDRSDNVRADETGTDDVRAVGDTDRVVRAIHRAHDHVPSHARALDFDSVRWCHESRDGICVQHDHDCDMLGGFWNRGGNNIGCNHLQDSGCFCCRGVLDPTLAPTVTPSASTTPTISLAPTIQAAANAGQSSGHSSSSKKNRVNSTAIAVPILVLLVLALAINPIGTSGHYELPIARQRSEEERKLNPYDDDDDMDVDSDGGSIEVNPIVSSVV